ncbi:Uncharacterised protein [Mycobacterium tuberculosis]|nr:Uncharacterised protein [Mycobacterium tuberculosis]
MMLSPGVRTATSMMCGPSGSIRSSRWTMPLPTPIARTTPASRSRTASRSAAGRSAGNRCAISTQYGGRVVVFSVRP